MAPEFSRRVPLGRIGAEGLAVRVEANEAERAAVAARLGLPEIRSLACDFSLQPAGRERIAASGRLRAEVVQVSVVSLDPFAAAVAEDFTCAFVPADTLSDEIDPDSEDELPYEGEALDLGEAATEQLALALDPYPRAPGEALEESGEAPPGAFDALDVLRKRN